MSLVRPLLTAEVDAGIARVIRRRLRLIDESGQFEKQQDPVTMAGLLVNLTLPGPRLESADAVLRRRFPELPWSFHRTYLDEAAYVALAVAQRTRQRPGGHYRLGIVEAAHEAAARLELHAPDHTVAVLQAPEAGKEPAYEDVSRLSRVLRVGEPRPSRVFEDLTRAVWEAVRQAVGLIVGASQAPRGFLAVSQLGSRRPARARAGNSATSTPRWRRRCVGACGA